MQQWQSDLIDMTAFARSNRGYHFILVVIDIFSRQVWARALKQKSGQEVARAFQSIFEEAGGGAPKLLQTDQGREFYNSQVRTLLTKYKVHLFSVKSAMKASLAERVNRTLKSRLWRYFTYTNQHKWFHILQDLVNSYNNTPHHSLPMGLTPLQAAQNEHWHTVWQHQESRKHIKTANTFAVGDWVRVSRWKETFEKGFTVNWSEEVYQVVEVNQRTQPRMYVLQDVQTGQRLKPKFYAEELQLAPRPSSSPPLPVPPPPQAERPPLPVAPPPQAERFRPTRASKTMAIKKLYK
jgi:hypothetical protein